MTYKLTLPKNCPLNGAEEKDQFLYRILKTNTFKGDDLDSYYEMDKEKYKNRCEAYSISLFTSREGALKAYKSAKTRNKIIGTYIGKVKITKSHGKLHTNNNSHYSLWLYNGVTVSSITCSDIKEITDK